nr:lef-11 [Mamestra configurata nucleopolyhedrovirus A]
MDEPRPEAANVDHQRNSQCCLTRSEVYALVREVINKRKHHNLVTNVCDHVFDDGFEEQLKYIRANIKKINKIFKLNKSLETEYKQSIDKYGSNRFNRNN